MQKNKIEKQQEINTKVTTINQGWSLLQQLEKLERL